MRKYDFPGAQSGATVDPSFLLDKVVSFFKDTAWPTPYDMCLPQWVDYAYELSHRAMWKTASRQELPSPDYHLKWVKDETMTIVCKYVCVCVCVL